MVDNNIQELTGADAPVSVGSQDYAYGITRQTGTYVYRNASNTPIHQVIHDALNGSGGFKGDIDSDMAGAKYSYLIYLSSEFQYIDRIKHSTYYNFFRRYIRAKVKPIFGSKINTTVFYNDGSPVDNTGFLDSFYQFAETVQATEEAYSIIGNAHDCVYLAFRPIKNGTKYVLDYYSPYQLMDYVQNDDYEVSKWVFWKGLTKDGKRVQKIIYEMTARGTVVTTKEANYIDSFSMDDYTENSWKVTSTSTVMFDFPIVSLIPFAPMTYDEVLPKNTDSEDVLRVCIDIWQDQSIKEWLVLSQGFSKFITFGMGGKGIGAFSGADIPVSPDGKTPPAPVFVSPPADNTRVIQEHIDQKISYMRDLMKENGVSTVERGTSQSQSGESKSFDFEATEQQLTQTVQRLQAGWSFIWKTWFKLNRLNVDQYEVKREYPIDFYPQPEEALVDLLDTSDRLIERGYKNASKQVLYKATRKALGSDTPDDTMRDIKEEIDTVVEERVEDESSTEDLP